MYQKPRGYRRNMLLLVGNYVTFGLGLALFSSSTVVPVFLRHLTDSQPLIGFVSAIFPLGWMLPQLFSARWVAGMARRKPALVYLSLAAPVLFAALAGVMFVTPLNRTQILLGVFIVDMALLGLLDGVIGVPWLDFVGRAVPGNLRGRMMGIQEVLYAVVSVGAGGLIAFLLSDAAPAFPLNFAYLATAASGGVLHCTALLRTVGGTGCPSQHRDQKAGLVRVPAGAGAYTAHRPHLCHDDLDSHTGCVHRTGSAFLCFVRDHGPGRARQRDRLLPVGPDDRFRFGQPGSRPHL